MYLYSYTFTVVYGKWKYLGVFFVRRKSDENIFVTLLLFYVVLENYCHGNIILGVPKLKGHFSKWGERFAVEIPTVLSRLQYDSLSYCIVQLQITAQPQVQYSI